MSETSVLPASAAVRSLFEDLLGREVAVGPGDPMVSQDRPTSVVAVFVDENQQLVAVLGLDISLAANAGAALGLMPVKVADESVEDGLLEPGLAENVSEVCNVLTSLLNREGAPHVRLHQVVLPGEEIPGDVSAHLLALGRRLDLEVEVSRYGTGRFWLSMTS